MALLRKECFCVLQEKHAETLLQLKTTLADEKALRHEIESQANEIATLATDLRSVSFRSGSKSASHAARLLTCSTRHEMSA